METGDCISCDPRMELGNGRCGCAEGRYGIWCSEEEGRSNSTVVINFTMSPLTDEEASTLVDELCDLLHVDASVLEVTFIRDSDGGMITSVEVTTWGGLADDLVGASQDRGKYAVLSRATGMNLVHKQSGACVNQPLFL